MRRHKFFAMSMIMVMLLFGVVGCGRDSDMDETKPPYNDETNHTESELKDTTNKGDNLKDDIKDGVKDAGDAIQDGIDDITNPGSDATQDNNNTQGTDLR